MKINARLTQRLERLEQTRQVERVPIANQLLRLALPQISDDDLRTLTLIFRRGAPISAHTAQEGATLERFSAELALAERKMAVQRRSESTKSPAHRTRTGASRR
jgi:hypothetical protein